MHATKVGSIALTSPTKPSTVMQNARSSSSTQGTDPAGLERLGDLRREAINAPGPRAAGRL
jgi:hypothetical protein